MKHLIVTAWLLVCATISRAQVNDSFWVAGNCEHCKERIEKAALSAGAIQPNWNWEDNLLRFSTSDSTGTFHRKLQEIIALAGHDNEAFQTTDKIYRKLPACCHYERYHSGLLNAAGTTPMPVMGVVVQETAKGKLIPLQRATIFAPDQQQTAITDSQGVFQIPLTLPATIIITYAGLKPDTLLLEHRNMLQVVLHQGQKTTLREIVIRSRSRTSFVASLQTTNTLQITSRELTKAACCNLSESFETSPAVDVSYADALTGLKQIQLLGLAGQYTQLLTENAPETRGLAGALGLTFIPGPWIESIQVTRGIGSVVNGYESISGQINVETVKPDQRDRLLLNTYSNQMGRLESNLNVNSTLGKHWSSGLLLHADAMTMNQDGNKDGFLDLPRGHQFNLLHRWKYQDDNGWIVQVAIKALSDQRRAGETNYQSATDYLTTNHYGVETRTRQYGVTLKAGYSFPGEKYRSIGLITHAGSYSQKAAYGIRDYTGEQHTNSAQLIYQDIIGTTNHKYRTGISLQSDRYDETFMQQRYQRQETVPGVFAEYTFTYNTFQAVAGIRADHHNFFGWQTTPRIHIKWDLGSQTTLRANAGSGFRMANIFAENPAAFVSSRNLIIQSQHTFGYGFDPEKAWNYGLSIQQKTKLNGLQGNLSADLYYTRFSKQVVVDADAAPNQLIFYALTGKSYSTSFQLEWNQPLQQHIDLRLAWRMLNVKTTYQNRLLEKPLLARYRAFMNLAWEPDTHWKIDGTAQWIGSKRLPGTQTNPSDKQFPERSPGFFLFSGQVSRKLGTHWELYLGAENIGNYRQQQLIIDAEHPFGSYFDASMVWGPVTGSMVYLGTRFRLK